MKKSRGKYKKRWVLLAFFMVGMTLLWFLVARPTAGEMKIGENVSVRTLSLTIGGKVTIVELKPGQGGVKVVINEPDRIWGDRLEYRLRPADLIRLQEGWDIILNATRYHPEAALGSYPGRRVENSESLILPGARRYVKEDAGIIWWNNSGQMGFIQKTAKLIYPEGSYGVGLQGMQVIRGAVNWNSIGSEEESFDRSFIGISPEDGKLWLICHDNATSSELAQLAVALGVETGGELDSGSSANLILPNFRGLRSPRPIGAAIGVKIEK